MKFFVDRILTATLLLFLLPSLGQAQSLTQRHSPRSMEGIRPLGMGGAFTAIKGSDENALFYNPAAINDLEKKTHMQFVLPTVEFSYKSISFFKDDLTDLADDIDAATTDAAKLDRFQAFTNANTGRYEEVGVRGNLVNFMHKYLSASVFYENRSILGLLNPASTTIDIEALTQGGVQVGSAIALLDEKLQVGAAVKFMERHLISERITNRDIVANDDFGDSINFNNMAFGIGADVGVKAKLPFKSKVWENLDPTVALTLQDVGDTRFFVGDEVGRQEQSFTAGLAINPSFGKKIKSSLAADFRDLDHHSDFLTKLHGGYELRFTELSKFIREIALRVGANQGYVTGGLGLDFKYFKLNAATWGREVGQFTRQKESRLFGLQLAAGF